MQPARTHLPICEQTLSNTERWTWAGEAGRFLLRLSAYYFGLLLLWLLLGGSYRALLINAGNLVFGHPLAGREVRFIEYHAWKEVGITERADIAILLQLDPVADAPGLRRYVLAKAVVTFSQPYTSSAFLLALFFASDVFWKRRLCRAALALVVLHLLMFGCVVIDVCHAQTTIEVLGQSSPRFLRPVVDFLSASVTDWPAGVFLVPLLLWSLPRGRR